MAYAALVLLPLFIALLSDSLRRYWPDQVQRDSLSRLSGSRHPCRVETYTEPGWFPTRLARTGQPCAMNRWHLGGNNIAPEWVWITLGATVPSSRSESRASGSRFDMKRQVASGG